MKEAIHCNYMILTEEGNQVENLQTTRGMTFDLLIFQSVTKWHDVESPQ